MKSTGIEISEVHPLEMNLWEKKLRQKGTPQQPPVQQIYDRVTISPEARNKLRALRP